MIERGERKREREGEKESKDEGDGKNESFIIRVPGSVRQAVSCLRPEVSESAV
jgi:hypothetical protein